MPDADLLALLRRIEADTIRGISADHVTARVGPFIAAIHPSNDVPWLSYAIADSSTPAADRAVTQAVIDELRRLFRAHNRVLRFEILEPLWPEMPHAIEAAGVPLQGRMPLMLCAPSDLAPCSAPGVSLEAITAEHSDERLAEAVTIARRSFGEQPPEPPPAHVAEFRKNLATGRYRSVLARLDGQDAGVGSMSVFNNELVGVGTLPAFRRRGVAATVSSRVVADHFAAGGDIAWLSAGEAAAEAAYRKIGFKSAGVQANYMDNPASPH